MALDNMMFFFIFMGLSPYTVLPYYVQHFTDSSILIGMIPAIYILGIRYHSLSWHVPGGKNRPKKISSGCSLFTTVWDLGISFSFHHSTFVEFTQYPNPDHLFCHDDLAECRQWFLCACLDRFYGQDGPA
jgi:hypothetical protein